jgi:DNA ligase 1
MIELPALYHRGSKGELRQWRVYTRGNTIFTEHGCVDGKLQVSSKLAFAKNVGKSNATTDDEQADKEAQALQLFKIERKYAYTKEAAQADERIRPMLAHAFEKRAGKINYPADMQPKLDGVRCLAYIEGEDVVLMSRSGKFYDVEHVSNDLRGKIEKNRILDGELYIHGAEFQDFQSLVKRPQEGSIAVKFHVYDVYDFNKQAAMWPERRKWLESYFTDNKFDHCFIVETETVNDAEEVLAKHDEYVDDDYEGGIVRDLRGVYRFGYRSPFLLKVKSFDDEEFKIVGFTDGRGKFKGCVRWICEIEDGSTFNVAPAGTYEQRATWYNEGVLWVGQKLTVKFFGKSKTGIPRFPIGLHLRDEIDMDA